MAPNLRWAWRWRGARLGCGVARRALHDRCALTKDCRRLHDVACETLRRCPEPDPAAEGGVDPVDPVDQKDRVDEKERVDLVVLLAQGRQRDRLDRRALRNWRENAHSPYPHDRECGTRR